MLGPQNSLEFLVSSAGELLREGSLKRAGEGGFRLATGWGRASGLKRTRAGGVDAEKAGDADEDWTGQHDGGA